MKFGKVLKVSSENMPAEMHDLFLRYKELKKQIKLIPVSKEAAAGEKQASVSPEGSATGSGSTGGAVTTTVLSPEEQAFITTLNEDLTRFNRYFIEKEEEAVIRLQALCDELAAAVAAAGLRLPAALTDATGAATTGGDGTGAAEAAAQVAHTQPHGHRNSQTQQQQHQQDSGQEPPASADKQPGPIPEGSEAAILGTGTLETAQQQQPSRPHHTHTHSHHTAALQAVKSRLVQFHGEMVLLLHWSLLNYAAVVKILKKHDKRTGVLLRAPYLANVLQQPFSSTTIMSRLAKRAEELVVATTQLTPMGPLLRPEQGPAATAAAPRTLLRGETNAAAAGASERAPAAAEGASTGRATVNAGGASASEASSLTFAAEREVSVYGDAAGQPLVGSTMHALETWANLRKNAITPSTVLAAEVEQPQQQQQPLGKRKANEDAPAETSSEPKLTRASDPEGQ